MRSFSVSFGSKLFVSAVLLAVCSSGGALAGTISRPHAPFAKHPSGWIRPIDAATNLAYVSDAGGFVDIFTQGGTLQGQLTGFTQLGGIYVDKAHNLWVTDLGSAAIYVFPRGSTSPSETLTDTAGNPDDVTVCPDGTVYVSNYASTSPPDATRGSIEVFPRGATVPSRYLQFADQLDNLFITCDAHGNVFTTLLFGGSVSAAVEFAHGRGRGTLLPIPLLYVGGIKADSAGNILVGDQAGHTITEYTEAGAPTGNSIATTGDIQEFALTRDGSVVGAADSQGKQGLSWTFPGGAAGVTYSDGGFQYPTGFAFDPPAPR